jgi:hypothetical protein
MVHRRSQWTALSCVIFSGRDRLCGAIRSGDVHFSWINVDRPDPWRGDNNGKALSVRDSINCRAGVFSPQVKTVFIRTIALDSNSEWGFRIFVPVDATLTLGCCSTTSTGTPTQTSTTNSPTITGTSVSTQTSQSVTSTTSSTTTSSSSSSSSVPVGPIVGGVVGGVVGLSALAVVALFLIRRPRSSKSISGPRNDAVGGSSSGYPRGSNAEMVEPTNIVPPATKPDESALGIGGRLRYPDPDPEPGELVSGRLGNNL